MFRPLFAFVLSVLSSVATTQTAPPEPAQELKRLEPLLGNWAGSGTARMGPGEPTKWTARTTSRWVLDGHFLQQDTELAFEGRRAPMVVRSFLGWDRGRGRYVAATTDNAGAVGLHEFDVLADGTVVQFRRQHQAGLPYLQRMRSRVLGEAMTTSVELLTVDGPGATIVEGTLRRSDQPFAVDWSRDSWEGAIPAPELQMLARSAGEYAVEGTLVPAPGAPEIAITGTDTFRSVFGDTILRGETRDTAEGMPGEYRGEVTWAFDAHRRCLTAVYVSNFGEVQSMDARWTGDGELVATVDGLWAGQPMVQRMVLKFGDDGSALASTSHTILGAADPFVSFRSTYEKKR